MPLLCVPLLRSLLHCSAIIITFCVISLIPLHSHVGIKIEFESLHVVRLCFCPFTNPALQQTQTPFITISATHEATTVHTRKGHYYNISNHGELKRGKRRATYILMAVLHFNIVVSFPLHVDGCVWYCFSILLHNTVRNMWYSNIMSRAPFCDRDCDVRMGRTPQRHHHHRPSHPWYSFVTEFVGSSSSPLHTTQSRRILCEKGRTERNGMEQDEISSNSWRGAI